MSPNHTAHAQTSGQTVLANRNTGNVYDLSLNSLDGSSVKLAQLHGKNVYIKFWATWCPLCLAGLEDFTSLAKSFENSADTVIISVVSPGLRNEVSKDEFIQWARSQNIDFPVLFDETGALSEYFNVIGYPFSVYLDKSGQIVKSRPGDEQNDQILKTLSSLEQGRQTR